MKHHFAIAIDGPSGAGKSTLAKAIATEWKILYVDTGAMYRSLAYAICQNGITSDQKEEIEQLFPSLHLSFRYAEDGLQHMYLNGEDVTAYLRTPEISRMASDVSAFPFVRSYLLEMQRETARRETVIMDGRDIGTVVLPEAEVKIFLTATAEERAKRRCLELFERGTPQPLEQVLADLQKRDENDSKRAVSPLRQAEDAILVDTTFLTFEESKQKLLEVIRRQLEK